jgi:hypothetical protein
LSLAAAPLEEGEDYYQQFSDLPFDERLRHIRQPGWSLDNMFADDDDEGL